MAGLINPVYIPVLEVPGQCSIAMFVLPPGSKLPLHDHPGMGVVAKLCVVAASAAVVTTTACCYGGAMQRGD